MTLPFLSQLLNLQFLPAGSCGLWLQISHTGVRHWIVSIENVLGLPFVADFMTYFPVYIYQDTFTHCRKYILQRFNSTDLEEVWPKFYVMTGEKLEVSPVNIVLSYAWYFEKDRYDCSFEITGNLKEYNKKFPKGHAIGPEHARAILSEPQTAFHVPYEMWLWPKVLVSYCLSHRVNPEFRSGESAQGESRLVWLRWLMSCAR